MPFRGHVGSVPFRGHVGSVPFRGRVKSLRLSRPVGQLVNRIVV